MKVTHIPFLVATVFALGLLSSRAALDIEITNHSFEEPTIPDGYYTVNSISGWLGEGSWYHVANPTDNIFTGTSEGSSGTSSLDGYNTAAVNNFGHILYQTLTETIQPRYTYTLTVLVGHRIGVPIDDVSIALVAGDRFLARAFPNPPEGSFVPVTVTYNSPASDGPLNQQIQIELRSGAAIAQGWFDDVHLYAEPSAGGTTPTVDSAYIPIPPAWQEWANHPDPYSGFTPFGGGGTLDPNPGPGVIVPEPSTFLAGALMLLPFGATALRRLRNHRKA